MLPEKLEARISEKRFLTAVQLLSESLKTIKQPEMMEIGALVDLRAYLTNQEVVGIFPRLVVVSCDFTSQMLTLLSSHCPIF